MKTMSWWQEMVRLLGRVLEGVLVVLGGAWCLIVWFEPGVGMVLQYCTAAVLISGGLYVFSAGWAQEPAVDTKSPAVEAERLETSGVSELKQTADQPPPSTPTQVQSVYPAT